MIMRYAFAALFAVTLFVGGGVVVLKQQEESRSMPRSPVATVPDDDLVPSASSSVPSGISPGFPTPPPRPDHASTSAAKTPSSSPSRTTDALSGLGSDEYADGVLPLGDGKYVTDAPKKGYVYLCHPNEEGGGAEKDGSWIHGNTWNANEKLSVTGDVAWPNASFSMKTGNGVRSIAMNDLPTTVHTGTFPIGANDPAYQFDRNPNAIRSQSLTFALSLSPKKLASPGCIGGEVGVMLRGVMLFDAFDALLRDAVAREVQDGWGGHPQSSGEYHYHGLPRDMKEVSVDTVVGFAFDGFPITGGKIAAHRYLTTEDLDECHGIESEVLLDGKRATTYHYVLTEDFPYSVSCFRGKSAVQGPTGGTPAASGSAPASSPSGMDRGTPPEDAISACSGKAVGVRCSFVTLRGDSLSGTCAAPPGSSLACVPYR
jgi:hypothetical protein